MAEMNPVPGTGFAGADPLIAKLLSSADEGKAQSAQAEQELKASQEREAQARAAQAAALKPKQEQLKAALGNAPAAPAGKALPKAPQQQPLDTKQMQETLSLITTLAALGGALTRKPLTAALTNFSAGVQGLVKGDQQAYKQNLEEFHANLQAAQADNEQTWKKYQAAKDKYKTDIAGLQGELKIIAAETQSPIDMELAKRGDVVSLMKLRETSRTNFNKVLENVAKFREAQKKDKATAEHRDKTLSETTRHHKKLEGEADDRNADAKTKAEAAAKAKKDKEDKDRTAKAETERRQRVRTFAAQYTDPDSVKKAVKEGKLGQEMAIAVLQEKFGFK